MNQREPIPAAAPPAVLLHDAHRGVTLYRGDCLQLLDRLAVDHPQGCFDCIFADPPYFLSNGGITCQNGRRARVDKGEWDASRGPEENHEFNLQWLRACRQVLKDDGTIWISGTHHVIFSIGYALQQLGFKILNVITWEKPNPPPNLSCRYFTHSTETILWAAKSETSKHTFHYQEMKKVSGRQMKTVWREAEFPHGDAAGGEIWKLQAPTKEEKSLGRHPTQKPLALIERCLLSSTNEGDHVFDPFLGSGTTAVACARLKRRFIGIELDDTHAQLAVERVKAAGN
jgi:site-specific DNA-methyltransferase (adenine-specific)